MQSNSYNVEIVICEDCHGTGTVDKRVSYNEYETKTCVTCDGTGRLRKIREVKYEKMQDNNGKRSN